jgi:hypothetical protein
MFDQATIQSLLPLVPRECSFLDPANIGAVQPSRYVALANSPDFGWQFVKAFHETNQPLPVAVTDPYLLRLYDYLAEGDPFDDFNMGQIIGLNDVDTGLRCLIKAYLLIPDESFRKAAQRLHLPEEFVEGYHTIFFNVRPRLNEAAFIQAVFYPHGRQAEFSDNYSQRADWEQLLLRCVLRADFSTFAYLSGLTDGLKVRTSKEALAEVENLIMNNAILAAKHMGGLNHRGNVGLTNAKNLISSVNVGGGKGGDEDLDQDKDPFLADRSVGQALMDELLALRKDPGGPGAPV